MTRVWGVPRDPVPRAGAGHPEWCWRIGAAVDLGPDGTCPECGWRARRPPSSIPSTRGKHEALQVREILRGLEGRVVRARPGHKGAAIWELQ